MRTGLWHFDLTGEVMSYHHTGIFFRRYIYPVQKLYSMVRNPAVHAPKTMLVSVLVGDQFTMLRRTLAKSRPLGDQQSVLLPLNHERHWKYIWGIVKDDIPFRSKADRLVWRGATTGNATHYGNRFDFVKWCFDHPAPGIDVGFTKLVQGMQIEGGWEKYTPGSLTTKEMLTNKFIVCLQVIIFTNANDQGHPSTPTTSLHMYKRTHTHVQIQTHARANAHTRTHTHTHTCVRVRILHPGKRCKHGLEVGAFVRVGRVHATSDSRELADGGSPRADGALHPATI